MMQYRMFAAWVRPVAGLFALLALLALGACGGGSGAPNNPYAALLTVTPANLVVVSGVPAALTVTGGTAPYSASSSNPGVLPVAQSVANGTIPLLASGVAAPTTVTITVTDSRGNAVVAAVTVQPGALAIVPSTAVVFSGVPATLTIAGGIPPYRVFSSNAGALPVTEAVPGNVIVVVAANVQANTAVTLTVVDSIGQSATAAITVSPAPLLNSLTITPNQADCGTTAICSGQNGTAVVTVLGPQGGPLAGRQVRFDVVAGPYGIMATSAGQPIVTTLTVLSDSSGQASVLIKANVNAPTQFAQLRVTELTSGQQLIGNFLIQQVTDGSKILTVVPSTATITGAFVGECSAGVRVDYYIYGGTPPYRVTPSVPTAVTLINPVVSANGGFFEAVTTGQCVSPMTFSIVDATGRLTTATLNNVEGSAQRPTIPVPDMAVSPATYTDSLCTGKAFPFLVSGGTPPYNVSALKGVVNPQAVTTSGGTATVSGLLTGDGVATVLFQDSSVPPKSVTTTITCSAAATPPSPALTASPVGYTSTSCTGNSFPIAIIGGTPPYNVTSTRGVATPAVVNASGGTTTISGLVTGTGLTAVVILDQSLPQKSVGVNITCDPSPTAPAPPALNVTNGFDYTASTCDGQISNFAITGGTPPYSVFFSAPVPAAGTITPTTVATSGQGFSVTGLTDAGGGAGVIRYIAVSDSGTVGGTQQQALRTIACP